ncbi:MAG: FkbM family methyltransferase [Rhodobacteraceae bacterium]|jgi:FkbM family methyltransferase|nr:FkbM family methyltransferase [Paracoccaceae bacterium]
MEPAPQIAATCHGVAVPVSPFLTPTRIDRITTARYEGEEIAGALALVRSGDRVLELGAGLGIVGAVAALNRAPAQVVSFEANPNLIPHVRALHALNGLSPRMDLRHAVLMAGADLPATVRFHLHASFLGSSLSGQGTAVDVPVQGWDAVAADLRPDVLLCDIEGGEADLLMAADLSPLRAVVVEFHPKVYGVPTMRALKRQLRTAGLRPVAALSSRTVWAASRDPADHGAGRPGDARGPRNAKRPGAGPSLSETV